MTTGFMMVHLPQRQEGTALLAIEKLTIAPAGNGAAVPLLENVDLRIAPGERLALIGQSGSGKTLCALATLGLLPPGLQCVHGRILYRGRNLLQVDAGSRYRVRGRRIAMIFQNAASALNPVFRIGAQMADVLRAQEKMPRKEARRRSREMLARVGFRDSTFVFEAYPHQLSGGMAQRVMIALALACRPELLIADEPTSALDVTAQVEILTLLQRMQREAGFALWLISHDIRVVRRGAGRIAVMQAGKIVETGATEDLFAAPRHPLTRQLIAGDACENGARNEAVHVVAG